MSQKKRCYNSHFIRLKFLLLVPPIRGIHIYNGHFFVCIKKNGLTIFLFSFLVLVVLAEILNTGKQSMQIAQLVLINGGKITKSDPGLGNDVITINNINTAASVRNISSSHGTIAFESRISLNNDHL